MRVLLPLLLVSLLSTPLVAESVVAARVIRARTIIEPEDLILVERSVPGALVHPEQAEGKEARKTIYAGRPIRAEDLAPPTAVERNQTVVLAYSIGGLSIKTEGRALDRAAVGEPLRVMNVGSRAMVTGIVSSDGTVRIPPES